MFGTSCTGSRRCCRGARLAWGLHGHAATSSSPSPAARPAPELAQLREGGWCWQLAMCLLPSIRQGRFLLFLSPPWQWNCSWVFILPPLHQCVPCASTCSPEPQPNPTCHSPSRCSICSPQHHSSPCRAVGSSRPCHGSCPGATALTGPGWGVLWRVPGAGSRPYPMTWHQGCRVRQLPAQLGWARP